MYYIGVILIVTSESVINNIASVGISQVVFAIFFIASKKGDRYENFFNIYRSITIIDDLQTL